MGTSFEITADEKEPAYGTGIAAPFGQIRAWIGMSLSSLPLTLVPHYYV